MSVILMPGQQSVRIAGGRGKENGLLAEHWDVIQDEATREESASGLPMFGAAFPS
jgi:predicted SnoaL-like aldol condensation-catalyzing enzyme